jgi:pSer/pThr/pTyr-binding forkhead associated (FHA) protein
MDVGLVCDECRTFNAMGARACARCRAALSLDGESKVAMLPTAPATGSMRECGTCGNRVPAANRFCGACGSPQPEETRTGLLGRAPDKKQADAPHTRPAGENSGKKTMFFGAMQAARAKLVVIKGDGLDGVSFTLAGAEHQAGRGDVPILFDEDPFLSPVHANFLYKSGKLVVRDEGSVNGVYIRIRGAVPFSFGDRVLVGEQVIEVQKTGDGEGADRAGTYFYASPRPASHFRLLQRLRGGDTGLAFQAQSDVVSLGREGNDINFPDDPFISGHHAQVSFAKGALTLTDLGSKNGTFLRITSETVLEHGDYVFMGQQLLRVEIV